MKMNPLIILLLSATQVIQVLGSELSLADNTSIGFGDWFLGDSEVCPVFEQLTIDDVMEVAESQNTLDDQEMEIEDESKSSANYKEIVSKPTFTITRMQRKVRLPLRGNRKLTAVYEQALNQDHLDELALLKILNSMDLNEIEKVSDVQNFKNLYPEGDRLVVHWTNPETGELLELDHDLTEKFFEAAVVLLNTNRLRKLFEKKKDLLLSSEQKAKIFKLAILVTKNYKFIGNVAIILKMLLSKGFYPKNHDLTVKIIGYPQDQDIDYPLCYLIHDEIPCKIFLDFDKKFFNKLPLNYVKFLISKNEYLLAIRALKLGCDPLIEEGGRNALDQAFDAPERPLTRRELVHRFVLIRMLIEEYKVLPTNTDANLINFCENKNWSVAIELIKLGDMKYSDLSPIGIALHYGQVDLISAALETYINSLPAHQLEKDLLQANLMIADNQQREFIKETVKKIRTRLAYLKTF